MARLDDDAVKALEVKHGPLLVIHIPEGADETLAFKAATAAHWRRLNVLRGRTNAQGRLSARPARDAACHG